MRPPGTVGGPRYHPAMSGAVASRVGLGCMRLSTDPARDEERALAVLHAALDAGVTLLDTADAYARDEHDVGHNERLVARALASWRGDRARIEVVTKGGLTRPGGRWIADGRARHLAAACEASLRALGVACLDLYLLHAPDPRTPLATSVRALAALQQKGLVRAIGLSNVNAAQLEEARRIAPIDAVEVKLGPLALDAWRGGLVELCARHGIRVLAHSPLGGPKGPARLARDPALEAVAARLGATPAEVALAWLASSAVKDPSSGARLDAGIVPIPGATRVETARSVAAAGKLELGEADRAEIDARFRAPPARPPIAASADAGEVVVLMGYPGAGKSTQVRELVDRGYERLNRDLAGGRLAGLAVALERGLAAGRRRFVLDNTYASRRLRSPVIDAASRHGVPARCIWLDTSLEDAQVNACERLVERYGALPSPEELARLSKSDPNAFGPQAQFRYRRELEPPDAAEGWSAIEVRRFERRRDPDRTERALVIEIDGGLRRSRRGDRAPLDPADVEVLPGRAEVLRRWRDAGFLLLGLAWQPEIAGGVATAGDVEACFRRMCEELGVDLEIAYCPHPPGPPVCWCREPLPGLGVSFIRRHRLDPSQSIHVGRGPADRAFAERLGFRHVDHEAFFAPVAGEPAVTAPAR